jgi:hypothetical protein
MNVVNKYVSLDVALAANGDAGSASAALSDIPVWIGREHVYCTVKKGVEVHELDRLVWVYAEMYRSKYGFQRGHQLVMWDRDSSASVLPLKKPYIDASLDRFRKAAPWIPVGYNEAMKESWNADRADYIALVDSFRAAGGRFEADWAGSEIAVVRLKPES